MHLDQSPKGRQLLPLHWSRVADEVRLDIILRLDHLVQDLLRSNTWGGLNKDRVRCCAVK